MATWTCDIVGTRPDGSLTWRREGATEPRGVLPAVLTPPTVGIGSKVLISATRNWSGQWIVVSCELIPIDEIADSVRVLGESNLPTVRSCGQLRWTSVMNPLENPLSQGKPRPALLVFDLGHSWRVMGFTTKDHYDDGTPRTPIPDHAAVGLLGPGYLWGDRLTRVRSSDIGEYIGFADEALVRAVLSIAHGDVTAEERRSLEATVGLTGH